MLWILAFVLIYLLAMWAALKVFVHPWRTPVYLSPAGLGLTQIDFETTSEDGTRLRGWVIPVEKPRAVAILIHGYMMNRSEMAPTAWLLAQNGVASVLIDLRAHGQSGGRKTGMGHWEKYDVMAAVQVAQRRYPELPRVLIGSSMGAASSALAMEADPDLASALVLDSAFSQLPHAIDGWWFLIGGKWLTWLMRPSRLLARWVAGFDPREVDVARALARFTAPVLVLHGNRDTLAPTEDARRNLEVLGPRGTAVWFQGRHHIEGRWLDVDQYNSALLGFIEDHVLTRTQDDSVPTR